MAPQIRICGANSRSARTTPRPNGHHARIKQIGTTSEFLNWFGTILEPWADEDRPTSDANRSDTIDLIEQHRTVIEALDAELLEVNLEPIG